MLDETQLRDGLGRMIRVDAADVPQSLVDSLIDEPSLGAAFAKAADAPEVTGTQTVILYFQAFLGRLPAPDAGLDFWTNGFNDGSQSLSDLKSFFTDSDEFKDRFDNFLSIEGVVTELFRSGLGREGAPEGISFWSDRGEALVDRNLDAGQSPEEAFNNAVADLAEAFVEAAIEGSPTEVARVDVAVDQILVEAAASGDDVFDTDSSLYKRFFAQVSEDPDDPTTTILALNSVAGTDEVVPFAAEGSASEIDTLRLTGDASVRIDLTDPNEQLEGIDIDGSANGVLEAGEVRDGITFDEQDQAFRDVVDVTNFDIIDAHPRGDALLNPNATDQGFTGNLYVDGTGFNGSGTKLSGNIVLGGFGTDEIITGNGNDFVSSGGLDDVIKTGRNADFIYQELSRLDDAFSGDDGEIDGGATSDADGTDSDWLLLEASDDEEPVSVDLATGQRCLCGRLRQLINSEQRHRRVACAPAPDGGFAARTLASSAPVSATTRRHPEHRERQRVGQLLQVLRPLGHRGDHLGAGRLRRQFQR